MMNAMFPGARIVAAALLVFIAAGMSFAQGGRRGTWRVTGVPSEGGYRQLSVSRLNEKLVIRYRLRPDGSTGRAEIVSGTLKGLDYLAMDERGTLYLTIHGADTVVKLTPGGPSEDAADACFVLSAVAEKALGPALTAE